MPKPPDHLGISQEAFERLLLQEQWLAARPNFQADSDERRLQVMLAEGTPADDPIGVIRQFVLLVDKGITPPAHVLAAVAKGLRTYVRAEGKDSLDESFGLRPKQRIGHPLTHRIEREKRGQIAYVMWCIRREAKLLGKPISIEDAAGEVINRFNLNYQEGTLKKDYLAMKADKVFDKALEAMGPMLQVTGKK